MQREWLFSKHFLWDGKCYVVHVYRYSSGKPEGSYMAETRLGPGDWVISDGRSPAEVLRNHQNMLPLAILSRHLS
jgi:hypothetical protein